MPHAGLARYLIMLGRGAEAREELALARNLSKGASSREIAQIEIIDIAGKIVSRQNPLDSFSATIDISTLQPGIYFLRIESLEGIVDIHKLVKEQ